MLLVLVAAAMLLAQDQAQVPVTALTVAEATARYLAPALSAGPAAKLQQSTKH